MMAKYAILSFCEMMAYMVQSCKVVTGWCKGATLLFCDMMANKFNLVRLKHHGEMGQEC